MPNEIDTPEYWIESASSHIKGIEQAMECIQEQPHEEVTIADIAGWCDTMEEHLHWATENLCLANRALGNDCHCPDVEPEPVELDDGLWNEYLEDLFQWLHLRWKYAHWPVDTIRIVLYALIYVIGLLSGLASA